MQSYTSNKKEVQVDKPKAPFFLDIYLHMGVQVGIILLAFVVWNALLVVFEPNAEEIVVLTVVVGIVMAISQIVIGYLSIQGLFSPWELIHTFVCWVKQKVRAFIRWLKQKRTRKDKLPKSSPKDEQEPVPPSSTEAPEPEPAAPVLTKEEELAEQRNGHVVAKKKIRVHVRSTFWIQWGLGLIFVGLAMVCTEGLLRMLFGLSMIESLQYKSRSLWIEILDVKVAIILAIGTLLAFVVNILPFDSFRKDCYRREDEHKECIEKIDGELSKLGREQRRRAEREQKRAEKEQKKEEKARKNEENGQQEKERQAEAEAARRRDEAHQQNIGSTSPLGGIEIT